MKEEVLCYDTLSGRFFKTSLIDLTNIFEGINWMRSVTPKAILTLNEVYEQIDSISINHIPSIAVGDRLGWESFENDSRLLEIDVTKQTLDDGRICHVINIVPTPEYLSPRIEL